MYGMTQTIILKKKKKKKMYKRHEAIDHIHTQMHSIKFLFKILGKDFFPGSFGIQKEFYYILRIFI